MRKLFISAQFFNLPKPWKEKTICVLNLRILLWNWLHITEQVPIFSLCFIILIVENQYSFIAIYIYIYIYIYIDFISITVFRKKAIVGISFNPNFNDGKSMDAKSLLISGFTFTFPFLQINKKNEKLKIKTV